MRNQLIKSDNNNNSEGLDQHGNDARRRCCFGCVAKSSLNVEVNEKKNNEPKQKIKQSDNRKNLKRPSETIEEFSQSLLGEI